MPRVPDLPCASCGKLMWRGSTSRPAGSAMCQPCRRTSFEHGTRKGYRDQGCRCAECRAWATSDRAEYRRKRRDAGRPLPRGDRYWQQECVLCGRTFSTRSRGQKYCDIQCVGLAKVRVRSKELVHVGPKPLRDTPPTPVTVIKGGAFWSAITSGPCAWCGEQFTALSGVARYCSGRCQKKRIESTRGSRFIVSPVLRRAIYERDGWTCQLCREPVEPDAEPQSDWYPTLDHIIPRSKGGSDDEGNLRTAHHWCNAVRGANDYHAELFEEAS